MAPPSKVSRALAAAGLLAAVAPRPAEAQQHNITIDRSFGSPATLTGPNYSIAASLGKQVGSNLFHSFGQFGLSTGESATFTSTGGAGSISNVIGRVTGGVQSNINGQIASTINGASLYLINPSGIVFGPNASVSVLGSFHASTADYVRMSDGAKFQATNPDASTFSAAPPAAFGFLTARPAALMVNGSTLGPVPGQGTLGLVAGPVSITGATLSAPAGTIHVTSAAGTGEVPVDPRNTAALTVTSLGPVYIKGGSTLDVSDPKNLGSGGSVFIRAGALTIDASEINGDNYGSGSGGVLSLRGDNQIALSNGANLHAVAMGSGNGADVLLSTAPTGIISADAAATVMTGTLGPGSGGAISVEAGRLTFTSGAGLTSSTQGGGNGGPIKISANSVVVDGAASIGSITSGSGAGGAIVLNIGGMLSVTNLGSITSQAGGSGDGGPIAIAASEMLIDGSAAQNQPTGINSFAFLSAGKAGDIAVTSGTLSIITNGAIGSATLAAPGAAGSVSVNVAGVLTIDGANASTLFLPTGISSLAEGSKGNAGAVQVEAGSLTLTNGGVISASTLFGSDGNAGNITVHARALSVASNGSISSDTSGSGNGGTILVSVDGKLSIDGSNAAGFTGIRAQTTGTDEEQPKGGRLAGNISVSAGDLSIVNTGEISSSTFGSGTGGSVTVTVAGRMTIGGAPGSFATGIFAKSEGQNSGDAGSATVRSGDLVIVGNGAEISSSTLGSGNAGNVNVRAATLLIADNGTISSNTLGSGNGGNVFVSVEGQLYVDGSNGVNFTGISSSAGKGSSGAAGNISVDASSLSTVGNGAILSVTFGTGNSGTVSVDVTGGISIDGRSSTAFAGIGSDAESESTGNAGVVSVSAGTLSIVNTGEISSSTFATGSGGNVTVTVADRLSISGVPGQFDTGIFANSHSTGPNSGDAGSVTVSAGDLVVAGSGGVISTSTSGSGKAGNIMVTAGALTLLDAGVIAASTSGPGLGGDIAITVSGTLIIDGIANPSADTGILARTFDPSGGGAGRVTVSANNISILNGGVISTSTFGGGGAGAVSVSASGELVIASLETPAFISGIASSANSGTGSAGRVEVAAGSLSIAGGGQIQSVTFTSGDGGDVIVSALRDVVIDRSGALVPTGIRASAESGSVGHAGQVVLTAGGLLALSSGAQVTSSTGGAGEGGTVQVVSQGPLTISGPGSGIIALAASTAIGDAGSVAVTAPQITITSGGEIASTTAGTGAGGLVSVTTPGALVLDGVGVAGTQIAASATGPQSGPGGSVTVSAGSLTVEGGAQIASSTAGPGQGGDVNVMVASDIVLPDPGPQITAQSTGSGDAGSITVSAVRLLMNDDAAISTEAETSTANGGNITLHVRDFLYLVSSEITTSVKGETGNGGNITIDPQLVILNHSSIIAEAIKGHGGDITITAGEFIPSSDSIVSATSLLGISGTIEINGPRVDVNGALVVLSSQLRGRTEVLREACGARSDRPISSLVEAGRGGLPQDPEATLPALYLAGRDLDGRPRAAVTGGPATARRTTAHLTMHCGEG